MGLALVGSNPTLSANKIILVLHGSSGNLDFMSHEEPDAYATVTVDTIRQIRLSLPRAYEALVRDRIKFRVGRIVFVSLSRDEEIMGFAFPRDERDALVISEPDKFLLPPPPEMRYQWAAVRLSAINVQELHEIIIDAWSRCVPKRVAQELLTSYTTSDRATLRSGSRKQF